MKKFFSEFKKFIQRGNVLDLAVGVIIGGAFSAIVSALSDHILKPIINWILAAILGTDSLSEVYTFLSRVEVAGVVDLEQSIYIDWGAFINAVINFVLIALVLFCIIKAINAASEGTNKLKNKYAPLTKEEIAAYRKEGKGSQLAELAKQKAEKLAEEQRLAEEEAAKNAPKTEVELLTEIADLLKDKQGK